MIVPYIYDTNTQKRLLTPFTYKAFAEGDLTLGLVGSEKFNAKTAREVKNALKDISQGKNLSPSFTSAKDAVKFLKA